MPVTRGGASTIGSNWPIGPGTQPNSEKNTKIRIRPSQKSGTDPASMP